MWGLIAKLLIGLAASVIVAALTYRKPEQTIEAEDEVGYPKAEEGSEIGKVFGTVVIKSPQVVWHGNLRSVAIVVKGPRRFGIVGPRSRTTVGYKYYVGVHFVACLGPVDALLRIKVEEKRAWRGVASGLPLSGDRITINSPSLFGGEKREGGIVGSLDFIGGYATQVRNDYLQGVLGASIPAFRGVVSIILRRMYLGTSAYLKPWRFTIQRVFVGDGGEPQWNLSTAGISRGITFRNAAVYITFDASGSMGGSKWEGQISALRGFLAAVAENRDEDEPNDFMLVRFGTVVEDSITLRDCDGADYAALDAWLAGQPVPTGSTNYEAAVSEAPGFFSGTVAGMDRILIFLTDGQPTGGSLPGAVATVGSLSDVDVYAFNIELADTSATSALDNTAADGVPVVVGGDPDSLISAFQRVFSNGYDMNPAHMLREVLIAKDTNGSGDAAEIGPTFAAAADTLFAEGFGLSFFWANPSDKAGFIREVEDHVDARIYQDRRTGLWEVKLIRADYDEETLPIFDRTNVVEWGDDIEWPDPSSLPNQVTVVFTDPKKDEPGSITLTNPARVQAIGQIINRKSEYRGINNSGLAARVASRDLTGVSSPLITGSIRARYVDPSLNLGSPIKLHNPRLGIYNEVVRITEIMDGDGRQNDVMIRFVGDRFAMPEVELVTVETIVTPRTRATASEVRLVEEAPYFVVADAAGQSDVDAVLAAAPGTGWLNLTGEQPTGNAIEFNVWRDAGAGYVESTENIPFCPVAALRSNLSDAADQTKIVVDYADIDNLTVGDLALIGDEIVRVDSVVTPAVYLPTDYWAPVVTPTSQVSLVTLGRGCLDTSPRLHVAGDPVLFWGGLSDGDDTAYLDGASVAVKLRTVTSTEVLALSSAPTDTVTFASRAIRPYPPGDVRADGSYAAPATWSGTVALTWAHRNRLVQMSEPLEDHTAGSIGPEAGTTYRVRVWPLDMDGLPYGSALLDVGAIAGTSYGLNTAAVAVPSDAFGMRIEVASERSGYLSTRNRYLDVPVVITPAMLPNGAWLDLNILASLWQDSIATVPVVADGDPLGRIENQRSSIL